MVDVEAWRGREGGEEHTRGHIRTNTQTDRERISLHSPLPSSMSLSLAVPSSSCIVSSLPKSCECSVRYFIFNSIIKFDESAVPIAPWVSPVSPHAGSLSLLNLLSSHLLCTRMWRSCLSCFLLHYEIHRYTHHCYDNKHLEIILVLARIFFRKKY